ncbi:MAG: carbohydrate porin [Holosporales bacterium]
MGGFAAAKDAKANTYETNLTGDWGGARTGLSDSGIDIEAVYKADVFSNLDGGIKTGTRALDNLDVIFGFDGEKIIGAQGLTASLHLLNNNGRAVDGELVGSAQGIDNIEVPRATSKLFQAWVQQNLFEDRLSILAGLYAADSEFYITDASGLFLHSTYGVGTDLAQSGANGPAIFPFSALAVRILMKPTEFTYIQTALIDGVAGDPNNPTGTQVELNDNDGILSITELGYTPNEQTKLAIGGWFYSEKFDDQLDVDAFGNPEKRKSNGFYVLGQVPLYSQGDGKGLVGFARFGFANDDVNQFDYAWSTGVVYTGLIPSRDEGQLGLGVAGAHNSSKYKQAQVAAGTPADSEEIALELTYSDNLTPWLTVQPSVQYISNPGTNPELDNAVLAGVRFTVNF